MVPSDWDEMDVSEMLNHPEILTDMNPFDHGDLTERIKRSLYYDPLKRPDQDTLSFSVTESAVSRFRHIAPMPSGKLGHRYASRVARDACISPCALLLGLIYIERLKRKNPTYLENISSSDLFLVSMMVASKYLYDEGCEDEVFNDEWAVSGEMEVAKVNRLEREFLKAIDWQLYVNPKEFSCMLNSAESQVALSNGHKRGWLTYSDLRSLFDCQRIYEQLTQAAGMLSKTACMCMIMYSSFVCLAAVTSTVLISSRNQSPFGPHPYRDASRPDKNENSTVPDSVGESNPESECSSTGQFPGFSSTSATICLRNFHRIRFRPTERGSANKELESSSLKEQPVLAGKILAPSVNPALPTTQAPCRKSTFSIFEAVLLMAHVPVLYNTNTYKTTDKCEHCGKELKDDKLPPIWHRNSLSNSTVYQKSLDDMGISPHRSTSSLRPLNKNILFGVFNPTMPPIVDPNKNRTLLGGFQVMVH